MVFSLLFPETPCFLVVEQSSLESQSRGCAKTPIYLRYIQEKVLFCAILRMPDNHLLSIDLSGRERSSQRRREGDGVAEGEMRRIEGST